jgi:hypothetical protein
MNRNRLALFLVVLLATSLVAPSSLAATKPKAAGRTSTAVINTVLNGKGAPSNKIGINGDFYIDTRSLLISGPKVNGKWPTARSLQGANGTNGVDGKNGSDAKNVTAASTSTGPAGPQGERGIKGADGAAGTSGAAGAAGVAGPAGSTGPAGSGATGAQGSPGNNGTNGTNGTNGDAGGTGLTGARGETGTVGPSEVTDISIPTWTLQTATAYGFATSSGFGLLKAGKSYQFTMQLWGTTVSSGQQYGLELLTSTGATPSYFYTAAQFRYAMTSTTSTKYGFSIIGTITVGESDTSLSIKIVDAVGDTTTKPMVMTGKALIILVGAVL